MRYLLTICLGVWVICFANCNNNDICEGLDTMSEDQIWNAFLFNKFQQYFILISGTISFVLLIGAALTWVSYKSFSTPSDIMLVIVIAKAVQTFIEIIQVIYQMSNQHINAPNQFQQACSALGFFTIIGYIVALYYNAFFCMMLAYSIRNTLKKSLIDQTRAHILAFIASVAGLLIIIFTQNAGRPLQGICIYKSASLSSIGLFVLHLIILLCCIYSVKKFKKKIPKNSFFQHFSHFRYFLYYMVLYCIIQSINSFIFFLASILCRTSANNLNYIIKVLFTISTVLQSVLSYAIAIMRFSHPILQVKIKYFFGCITLQQKTKFESCDEQLTWLESLVDTIKGSQILSYISAIMINFIQNGYKCPNQIKSYHLQKNYLFILNESIAEDYIKRRITNRQSIFNNQRAAGLATLDYKVICYTPSFYSFLFRNQTHINLFKSFDIRKNLSIVTTQSYTEGGKSGQFFFATHDHQFIFKTITVDEVQSYLEKIRLFSDYYQQNENSLLIKILGLYKFTRKDLPEDIIYIMLMKNVTLVDKRYNLRVYDIKGSQFNRSTLTEQKIDKQSNEQLKKYTLKDLDFIQLEGKIKIDPSNATKVKQVLIRDVKFLGTLGVMDYSILIIKRLGPSLQNRKLQEFQSIEEPGIFYNFGVIDYLEEWTLKRRAERVFKTMITDNEVTAQAPLIYSKRLIQFIELIF